jgi:nicotinate-nucleotide adenylyltransferase
VGVLGGSFDPVHNAHLIVAQLAREQLELDVVLLMVAAEQPLKLGQHMASAADRLRMVTLAADGVPGLRVDDRELRRPPPSYTVDTLRALHAELPAAELVLILGADAATGLSRWRDPRAIAELARIAVCQRGSDAAIPAEFTLRVAVPQLDISSTAIRRRAAAGASLAGWVPERVADYIVASQVYGSLAG